MHGKIIEYNIKFNLGLFYYNTKIEFVKENHVSKTFANSYTFQTFEMKNNDFLSLRTI